MNPDELLNQDVKNWERFMGKSRPTNKPEWSPSAICIAGQKQPQVIQNLFHEKKALRRLTGVSTH